MLKAFQKFRDRRILCALLLATLTVPVAIGFMNAPAFADVSPQFNNRTASANVENSAIQLAQANMPPVGSLDDYVREGNEQAGGSPAATPPQAYQQQYQPQAMPPQGYPPQGPPPQDGNNGYTDPNAARSALIGAAVVGAVAVGMWAWQQHEIHQAQRHAGE